MKKLFGTDGVRGVANQYPMTAEMALNIGRAAAYYLKGDRKTPRIVVGKDTRLSGDMLENALTAGICSVGVDVDLAGVMPTPGVAYLAKSSGACGGIVISASHNPFYDNGIKLFGGDGYKLSDEAEAQIEEQVLGHGISDLTQTIRHTGRVFGMADGGVRYGRFIESCLTGGGSVNGLKIVIDCANGATSFMAGRLFRHLGAEVDALFDAPDGHNINDRCGSQFPQALARRVVQEGAAAGLAFDGDGDRLIAVDERGHILTGDQLMAICARAMQRSGKLKNGIVVSTVMSNIGFGLALRAMGIEHVTADVGDRYVMQKMMSSGAVLGGEDSGHLIFLDHHTTGDGMLAATQLIGIMAETSEPLSGLSRIMTVYPQVLTNVTVRRKPDIDRIPEIANAISAVQKRLGDRGRVLVRYSGTQPMCRVMVEGPSRAETEQMCSKIAEIVSEKLA